ncbi:DUF853 family protein [Candidatus Woesearchaeota archaeon]|nr:MAG: DUF853 family protein [Candidatus Woesearchaeota archaeon]
MKKTQKTRVHSVLDSVTALQKKRKHVYFFLIALSIIFSVVGILLIKNYLGYASFAGEGGNVYELDIYFEQDATYWAGLYGVALRFDGWNVPWSKVVYGNSIDLGVFLFDCMQVNLDHELYASLVNASEIDWSTIQGASPEDINAFLNLSDTDVYSALNMFTSEINVSIGNTSLIINATFTNVYNQTNATVYDVGLLKDGNGTLVFVSHITDNATFCYYGGICNYQMLLPIRNGTNETYHFFTDPYDQCLPGEIPVPLEYTFVNGTVSNTDGMNMSGVLVVIGNYATYTDSTGFYNFTLPIGDYHVFAVADGYKTYHNVLNLTTPNVTTVHNILLSIQLTGKNDNPGKKSEDTPKEKPQQPQIEQPSVIREIGFIISIAEINRKIKQGNFIQEFISFVSVVEYPLDLYFTISGPVAEIIQLDEKHFTIEKALKKTLTMTIFGKGEPRVLTGFLNITGTFQHEIPITIEIIDKDMLPVEALLIDVQPLKNKVLEQEQFRFKTNLKNLLIDEQYPVTIHYSIQNLNGSTTYWTAEENIYLLTSASIIKSVKLPKEMKPGEYVLRVTAYYLDLSTSDSAVFIVERPFYQYKIFGIPLWIYGLFLVVLIGLWILWKNLKKAMDHGKKYRMVLDYSEIPKDGPRGLYVGNIAETKRKTYFDMDNLKTHTIIAGSTGSGKSFTAQVIAEEALDKNVAVIIFDPTAQWTGMLRKCQDRSIIKTYGQFDMQQKDIKAFSGSLKMVTNAYEEINIAKYTKPGEIQIFVMNNLEPEDIEIFVSNTVREIFKEKLTESKELKLLLVYDEVHRLLPKFGGTGIGFLQIERAIREFRKWGVGLLLISHVLNDFVEQIQANINTQVQMKTRDESDLERIRMKYGQNIFRSMVKTKVGTGLVENSDYNKGEPYFVDFRPIKHSLTRLSEEEIKKYHNYQLKVDQISYEIEQLEELKHDVFNLNLTLKLLTKKLKEGNFYVVDIYLDEISAELEKAWQSLRKKPKKLEIKLIDKKEIENEIKKARAERETATAKLEKSKQPKIEDAFAKEVSLDKALNMDNGATILSLQELLDVLKGITPLVFKKHVNEEKNDLANWVKRNLQNEELAKKLEPCKASADMIKVLEDYKATVSYFKDEKKK